MKNKLMNKHQSLFSKKDQASLRVFFAPGRVNLIGEHTDYNGGHVFPCALTNGTYAVVTENGDKQLRLYSENFEDNGIGHYPLGHFSYNQANGWCNYVLGVFDQFEKLGYTLDKGFDILIYGNIPNGAGLSSSASLELVIATLINTCYGFNLPMIELVKLCQRAENQFIGVKCGIMDQFAIGMGKKDHAILLNTATLEYQYAPVQMDDHQIVIINTNKRRGLADSKYNERRMECDYAVKMILPHYRITTLGELNASQFETVASCISDTVTRKRAKHAVMENLRTLEAVNVLQANDLAAFGRLMNASHISLRDDYEVSCIELDTLVSLAWELPYVIGARMTGAGFGGCTVNIVEKAHVQEFMDYIAPKYYESTGLHAEFYSAQIGDGAREL